MSNRGKCFLLLLFKQLELVFHHYNTILMYCLCCLLIWRGKAFLFVIELPGKISHAMGFQCTIYYRCIQTGQKQTFDLQLLKTLADEK